MSTKKGTRTRRSVRAQKRADGRNTVIDLRLRLRLGPRDDGERWWSPGRFKTQPSWYVGHPFIGVTIIEHDIRNAEDWAWLMLQVHQLQALYEARTGRELVDAKAWCEE